MELENKIDKAHEGIVEKEVVEEKVVELTPEETRAAEDGWKPLEAWEKDGKAKEDWRPAKEYNERGELFERIEAQSKEIKQVRKVLDTLKNHHLKVKQTAMEDAIALLKRQRAHATKEEDLARVLEITDEIDSVKEKFSKDVDVAQELEKQLPQEPHPDYVNWHKANKWYKQNVDDKDSMSLYADRVAEKYVRDKTDWTYDEVFKEVDKALREEFPERFKTQRVTSTVEGNGGTRPTKNSTSKRDMTEAEKKIGDTLVRSGVMTWEKYQADLDTYDRTH